MCNVRTISYSCSHTIPFRLSTCAGTFTYQTRKYPTGTLPSCRSFPLLTFISPQPCGACLKAASEQALEEKIARLRLEHLSDNDDEDDWTAEPPEALVQAEAELASEVWRLEAFYPEQARFKKDLRPEKGPAPTRSESLLRREVLPEDVVKFEYNGTTATEEWDYESWRIWGYGDLSEEIAEDERERVGMDLPAFVDCGFDACLDEGDGGDGEGEGEEHPDEEIGTVMDWGAATCWVLSSEGGGWDAGNVDVKVESENDEVGVQEVTDIGLVEDQTPEHEAKPVEAACTLKENNSTECAKAPHWRRERPSVTETPQQTTAMGECSPKEENKSSSSARAPHWRRQRPHTTERPRQKAMDGYEPFRACSPFWMEFAVSV